jgi:PAS domain S-box-containing protein
VNIEATYPHSAPSLPEQRRIGQEFHRLILDNVADLIAVLDTEGRRLYNNPAYHSILGDVDKLRGTDSVADVHPEDREKIRAVFQKTIESGIGQRAEFRFLLPDGTVRHIESQGNVIRDELGRPSKVVVVSRDITSRILHEQALCAALADAEKSRDDLQAAQRQLLQSEKLEAISTFAGTIAHEVKNPLQTIVLGIDYLTNYGAFQDENAKMLLEHMTIGVRRCDAIIHGLMEFSSYNKKDVRAQSLSAILDQALRAHKVDFAQRRLRVLEEFAKDLPLLRLDSRSIKHVFINLIAQAAQGLPPGSSLNLKAFTHNDPAISIAAGSARVVAEIIPCPASPPLEREATPNVSADFTLLVSRKIIELYGGTLRSGDLPGSFVLSFKT